MIGDQGGNIDELQMMARAGARDFFDLDILLEVHDLKHLNDIMMGLQDEDRGELGGAGRRGRRC